MNAEPDEIIAEMDDIEAIRRRIVDWQAELMALNYAPDTIKNAMTSVRSWLWMNVNIARIPRVYIRHTARSRRITPVSIHIKGRRDKRQVCGLLRSHQP